MFINKLLPAGHWNIVDLMDSAHVPGVSVHGGELHVAVDALQIRSGSQLLLGVLVNHVLSYVIL